MSYLDRLGSDARRDIRIERILRLEHLIARAIDERQAGGYRGGVAADAERETWLARWRAERAVLIHKA